MKENLVSEYSRLLKRTKTALEAETAQLLALQASVNESQLRINGLESAVLGIEMGIEALNSAPEIHLSSATKRAVTKVVPIPRGQAPRLAFDILRESSEPISVPDLAIKTFSAHGIDDPTPIQIQALSRNLTKSLNDAVAKGTVTCEGPQVYLSSAANHK